MYTIGDISKIVNISANTLRYYDEIGLLKPHLVEATNQYRYYSDSQIKDITFILELKQYGFSLEEIKILVQDKNNYKLKPMLEQKLIELQRDMERIKVGARDFVSKPISSMRLIQAMEVERTINIDRINNIANMLQKESNEKVYTRALKQEEIDLIIFKDEWQEDEAINNIFYDSVNKNTAYINGPEAVDLEVITYIKDKFSESLQEFSRDLSNQLNSTCKLKLATVQNVTISEFKTLMSEDGDIGIIKYNMSSLPINIHLSGGFNNKRKLLTEIINLTEKQLERIIHGFDNVNKFISLGDDKLLSENYSTIAISFSIEFLNKDNGFINISLPHDFLQYLDK